MAGKSPDHFEELKKRPCDCSRTCQQTTCAFCGSMQCCTRNRCITTESLSGDSERILTDLLSSPGFSSDFFSLGEDKLCTEKAGDTVRIACLDIGSYRPEDMTLRVEGDHVLLQGKRTQRINMGVEGAKFSRAFPIPQGVNPKRITSRYSALDGQYIVEGVKEKSSPCRRRKTSTAYFDETKMSLTVELGSQRAQELVYDNFGLNRAESVARNSNMVKTTTDKDKVVI